MLQLDTRPSSSWTSSSTYNADGRSLPAEFSLSTTLQKDINSGVFDLSRLSARSRPPTTATTISDSMHHHQLYQHHNDSIAGGNNNSNKYNTGEHERRPLTKQKTHNNNKKEREEEEEEEDAELNKIIISRRILSLERERERKVIAKPVQPTRNPATPLETEPETLNLPPIRLASSRTSRSRSRSSSSRSSSRSFRASSSPSSSPSPSPSPSISPSLLPSIEEPHLPSLRGRLHSASTSASTPTDNTSPSPTQSSSSKSNFDLVNPAGLIGLTSLPLHLPSSDRIGIDNDATIAATVAAALVDVNVGCRLPPILSGASTTSTTAPTGGSRSRHIEDSSDGRTSKKRTLEEYQGHSDHFSSRRAPASIVHPLSQSLTADSIANPSSSGLPISLAPIDSISASESQLQPSRSSPSNPSVKPVPRRLHESDLPNRTDIDNSVESTIVLAHRAVTAIKNQSLPRPKTIGPTFTIGKQPSHPFGVAGRPHDGVMESEDESDSASTTTTTTSTPSLNKPRMMPWDRKKPLREESPALDQNFFPDLDPAPLSGSIIRPDSSPKRGPGQPGIGSLINLMGGSTERSRMIAADVRTDQPLQPVDSESESQSPEDTTGDAGEASKDSTGQEAPSTTTNTTNTVLQTIPPISGSIDGHPGDGDGGEDPNDKRSRKLSEHEQDNGSESISSGREKRRKLEELADGVPAEPQIPGKSDQDAAVSSPFGLSKGPSPPPVPSGPPTVESVPSTTATLDSGPAYSESETPATMCGASDYYKSPVETSSNNTLPPIHSPSNHSPGRQNMSPRSTHTTLPSVDNLFTVASAAEKHSMDHQQIQQNHTSHNGKYSKSVVIQHLKIVPNSSPNPTPNTRAYVDGFTRGIAFNDPAQNFRTMVPRPRQSPTVSPIEGRNAPIAPAPANNFSGQASTSPLNQFTPTPTYFPPKNLNRPEHPANHATLPPLQTDWSGSLPPSEPGSARTPTSKKRARNGTPKNGSIDSSQNSPTVAGGFKCNKEGCTAAPFSTQYLLNSHANVHSEDRPHFCPVAGCSRAEGGKGFKRKNEMIRHGLVHQSPGYVCPFCPDKEHRYPRPDNLQRHVKAHHKDKSGDDPLLREVLAVRPEGGQRGRRRRLGPNP
ncbi:hypothetical protein EYR41_006466 [Orbilia oligospora]|uniref:Uncharacterized protein n=2 Tax=Orbilia oligospora TaxID=2813651 RepID=A0A7C8U2Q8_ORBOL|nr:hypothetical protein TWF751_001965 [Orbilia oligospora]TGJ67330.1 hypothetical protein EYR41_006466 [Orbilia oligospora]